MWLLVVALFGLIVPNGMFVYWLFFEFSSLSEVASNTLATAFILDAFMTVGLLAILFAVKPLGKVKWHWSVFLSFVGGLGFGIPFYWWLNKRLSSNGEV